jgi:hypothetical protein
MRSRYASGPSLTCSRVLGNDHALARKVRRNLSETQAASRSDHPSPSGQEEQAIHQRYDETAGSHRYPVPPSPPPVTPIVSEDARHVLRSESTQPWPNRTAEQETRRKSALMRRRMWR